MYRKADENKLDDQLPIAVEIFPEVMWSTRRLSSGFPSKFESVKIWKTPGAQRNPLISRMDGLTTERHMCGAISKRKLSIFDRSRKKEIMPARVSFPDGTDDFVVYCDAIKTRAEASRISSPQPEMAHRDVLHASKIIANTRKNTLDFFSNQYIPEWKMEKFANGLYQKLPKSRSGTTNRKLAKIYVQEILGDMEALVQARHEYTLPPQGPSTNPRKMDKLEESQLIGQKLVQKKHDSLLKSSSEDRVVTEVSTSRNVLAEKMFNCCRTEIGLWLKTSSFVEELLRSWNEVVKKLKSR
ncbi:hypothetical protein Tco_1229634 [Tanacetum coccineum]